MIIQPPAFASVILAGANFRESCRRVKAGKPGRADDAASIPAGPCLPTPCRVGASYQWNGAKKVDADGNIGCGLCEQVGSGVRC